MLFDDWRDCTSSSGLFLFMKLWNSSLQEVKLEHLWQNYLPWLPSHLSTLVVKNLPHLFEIFHVSIKRLCIFFRCALFGPVDVQCLNVFCCFRWLRVSSSGQYREIWCTRARKMVSVILTEWHVTTVNIVAFGDVWMLEWRKKVSTTTVPVTLSSSDVSCLTEFVWCNKLKL